MGTAVQCLQLVIKGRGNNSSEISFDRRHLRMELELCQQQIRAKALLSPLVLGERWINHRSKEALCQKEDTENTEGREETQVHDFCLINQESKAASYSATGSVFSKKL
ncbi:hypothetical protein FOZ62_018328, partial [Perkinsus olseni]